MSNTIPVPNKIDVPEIPTITYVELVRQVFDNINSQIYLLEGEIGKASQGGGENIKALYTHVNALKTHAEQASQIIGTVSEDPQQLQTAVTQFEGSGETLHKMEKLVEAIDELEHELKAAEFDYYRTVAELLTDVKEQLSPFDAFAAIPHHQLISAKVHAIEKELGRQVQWSCREIGQLVSSDPNADADAPALELSVDMEQLSQVYLLVDVLGYPFRKDLLERFAQLQLIPYEKLFKAGTPLSGLDELDKRFVWFEKLLKVAEQKVSSIFPVHWRLSTHLFIEFSRRTKKHLADVLEERERENPDANTHVKEMLTALKSVKTFETRMRALLSVLPIVAQEEEEAESNNTGIPRVKFQESIADAFDTYLGPYVQLERETLEKLMLQLIKEEENGTSETANNPNDSFVSSRRMFEHIKTSLKRCTDYSTGLTYLSLSKEFRICLHHYSESLKFRCPQPVSFTKSKDDKQIPIYELNQKKEALLCQIVTTAAYCIDTIPALETMMKKHINPVYTDDIDFSGQSDVFMDLVSFAYTVHCKGIAERMEPAFKTMRHTNWTNVDMVGDDSAYIKDILKVASEATARVRARVPSIYFQNFCMKLSTIILDHFLENLWKLKRIAKTGGGQLSLDLMSLKEYLLKMPNIRLPQGQELLVISKPYKAFVNTRTGHIENILKLVSAEEETIQEMFPLLWPDGEQADLDRIISLRVGTGFSIPGPAGAVFDKVGDHVKDKIIDGAVGRAAKGAVGEMGKGITKAGGFMSSVFNTNLFDEGPADHSKQTSKSPAGAGAPKSSTAKPAGGSGSSSSAPKKPPPKPTSTGFSLFN